VPVEEFPYALTRAAFSPRDAARAGDVWRAFQDVAVQAASRNGWSPMRMSEVRSAFVVRTMTVVHHRETAFGEPLLGRSWVRKWRRDMLSTREVRLTAQGLGVASGTQEWAHIGENGALARAPAEMIADLGEYDEGGIELPTYTKREGATRTFAFRTWHTWMDPLGHVNHPMYVDFCDEATSVAIARLGVDPVGLAPVAEQVTFRVPVFAGDEVTVTSRLAGGREDGTLALHHVIGTTRDPRCAEAITLRRMADGSDALARVFLGDD